MTAFSKLLSCAAEAAVTERVLQQRVVLFISWYSHTVVSLGADDLFIPLPRCDVKWLFWKIGQILKRDISLIKDKSSKIWKVWLTLLKRSVRTCSCGSHRGKTTWLLITMERKVMSRRLIQFKVQIARYFLGLVQPWSQKRCFKTVYWQQSPCS